MPQVSCDHTAHLHHQSFVFSFRMLLEQGLVELSKGRLSSRVCHVKSNSASLNVKSISASPALSGVPHSRPAGALLAPMIPLAAPVALALAGSRVYIASVRIVYL